VLFGIVTRNWISFIIIILTPVTSLCLVQYTCFSCVDQLVTRGAVYLVVFPFKLPSSGPNMYSAFTMFLLVMGQFGSPPLSSRCMNSFVASTHLLILLWSSIPSLKNCPQQVSEVDAMFSHSLRNWVTQIEICKLNDSGYHYYLHYEFKALIYVNWMAK